MLRDELSAVFAALRTGNVTVEEAAELANLAGKMISSAKVQVAYYELLKTTPSIEFLSEDSKA
ncbi:MAG: hypothetical protein KAY54_04375 [Burkholderiaceae bacterium]|nr:hypothetical protein [Burkholderiaceae bacterium]